MWTEQKLWELRKQIRLCSLFVADYRNNLGVEEHVCCDFFDGYSDYLSETMAECETGYNDKDYFDLLPKYDTSDNLYNWYGCFEEEPLPIVKDEED